MSAAQQNHLKILVHVLFSNPRVLYAPNNTAADTIIVKVSMSILTYRMGTKGSCPDAPQA